MELGREKLIAIEARRADALEEIAFFTEVNSITAKAYGLIRVSNALRKLPAGPEKDAQLNEITQKWAEYTQDIKVVYQKRATREAQSGSGVSPTRDQKTSTEQHESQPARLLKGLASEVYQAVTCVWSYMARSPLTVASKEEPGLEKEKGL
mmetsp:Transcript_16596/g.28483  ORF Transcript_16596/g.28483 Transcript_16596/m.28483 type:complete len:151 (+) Transcript_16596:178-630(+)|eukprot:CAMPEP_0119103040 /NCGR_PEP_ID=MMETSP1180-20130426/1596_1 /TAXON_ID=3052 ORGANISM="Chlamydomonas cf sp, Strain CCMP681" /NCGR_SAMPLE_ID=MMETSP1180 /ASSEMBLY_ACC=CAM_ASM_000741 /LENGTH=150 /DNA_ID=CAMNT_0007087455 /DNA_START=178 /DNA_END=630 /DNA_ORIENTATION=-